MKPVLYTYWRSSSAYRVRIALNLKGIDYESRPVHLVRDGGEQKTDEYRAINPLGLVPALVIDGQALVQSVAICEYLEERYPQTPLLPADLEQRARVRALVQTITSEVQPLNNLAVLQYLKAGAGLDDEATAQWYSQWVDRAFSAVETWLEEGAGSYCHGDQATLADCFLVPQVYNAERFNCDLDAYFNIRRVVANCRKLSAFDEAAPENQADAEG